MSKRPVLVRNPDLTSSVTQSSLSGAYPPGRETKRTGYFLGAGGVLAYLAVAALCLTAIWISVLLQGNHDQPRYFVVLIATGVSAYLFSTGPAIAAAVLSIFGAWYVITPPRSSFVLRDGKDTILFITFAVTAAVTAYVMALLRRQQRRVRRSEQLFRTMYSLAAVGIEQVAENGKLLMVNRALCNMLGYTKSELLNKTIEEITYPADRAIEAPLTRALMAGKCEFFEIEKRYIHRTGSLVWVNITSSAVRDRLGNFEYQISVVQNISERKKAEEALRYGNLIIESSDAAIIGKTLEGIITSWNPGAVRLYGYTADDVVGKPISVLMPPDQQDEMPAILARLQRGEQIADYETVRMRKDGTRIDVAVKISPIFDDKGAIVGASSIGRDITQRKQAEEAFRESEARFRLLADNISQFAWITDERGWVLWCNQRWYDYTGTNLEEMRGLGWRKVHHPDHLEPVIEKFKRAVENEEPWEDVFPLRSKDGQYRWFLSRALPIRDENGKVVRWFGTNTDITEQREVEQALRESEEAVRTVLNSVYDGIVLHDSSGRILEVNERFLRMYGLEQSDIQQLTVESISSASQAANVPVGSLWQKALSGEPQFFEWKARRPKDGSEFDVEVYLRGVRVKGTDVILANIRDISERKHAERELRNSERRFRVLTEALPQFVWTADSAGNVDYVNRRWLAYTGQERQETLGLGSFAAVHPDDLPTVQRDWLNAVRTGIQFELEFRLRGKNGQYRWFLGRGVPLRNEQNRVERWFGTCTDIHDLKMAQVALIRSEKLASVGRMAMTIAHEINNPLAAVMNTLFLLRTEAGMSNSALKYINLADGELRRISHITRQALGFYRESTTPTLTSLNEVLDSVTELLNSKIKSKHITVVKQFKKDVQITAVSGELRQVFSNLLSNAIDAVKEKGKIFLRLSTGHDAEGKQTVRITVADNGTGIAPSSVPYLFEPFFTTKEAIGTGLGLWVTKEIVDKHKGCIRVRSRSTGELRGTVFSIVLPMEGIPIECPPQSAEMAG